MSAHPVVAGQRPEQMHHTCLSQVSSGPELGQPPLAAPLHSEPTGLPRLEGGSRKEGNNEPMFSSGDKRPFDRTLA